VNEGDCVYRHTGQPEPRHFSRQAQWKTCWQRMVRRPVVSSIRSRHTGQVGNSINDGVGGARGFAVREVDLFSEVAERVNGSFVF